MTDDMTPRARAALEDYLDEVRALLEGTEVDASEVAEDVRDHVAEATSLSVKPVDADEVTRVLLNLGPPNRWAPAGDAPGDGESVRDESALTGLRTMALVVFWVTVVALAAFPWIGPFGLLVAWVLARGTVARFSHRQGGLGPWRWMVLPPLVVVAVALAAFLILAPIVPLAEVPLRLPRWLIVVTGLALWYGVLTLVAKAFPGATRWLLYPLLPEREGDG